MTDTFIYPRTISVHRFKTVAGISDAIGLTGYSGTEQSTGPQGETALFTGIPASIQAGTSGKKKQSSLPQDIVESPSWNIFIPLTAMAQYSIRDRDVIVDDEGYRYEVGQAYWDSLGYKLTCVRLEA